MRKSIISKELYDEIKYSLEKNSIAQVKRDYSINEAYVVKIKRSYSYDEFMIHRNDKWFYEPYTKIIGKFDDSFNSEWYFEPDNLEKIKEEL